MSSTWWQSQEQFPCQTEAIMNGALSLIWNFPNAHISNIQDRDERINQQGVLELCSVNHSQ